jgi:hypothetical protein
LTPAETVPGRWRKPAEKKWRKLTENLQLKRLAAMTPRPETNLLICDGLLAPRARWRRLVVT